MCNDQLGRCRWNTHAIRVRKSFANTNFIEKKKAFVTGTSISQMFANADTCECWESTKNGIQTANMQTAFAVDADGL